MITEQLLMAYDSATRTRHGYWRAIRTHFAGCGETMNPELFLFLWNLHRTLGNNNQLSINAVTAEAFVGTNITYSLQMLKKRGFIVIKPNKLDSRSKLVSVTPAGVKFLQQHMQLGESGEQRTAPNADRLLEGTAG